MLTYLRFLTPYLNLRFLRDRRGTPSIETVLLIALIALAIAPYLTNLTSVIGGVFNRLGQDLSSNVGP